MVKMLVKCFIFIAIPVFCVCSYLNSIWGEMKTLTTSVTKTKFFHSHK